MVHSLATILGFDSTRVAVALIAAVASCVNTLGLAWVYMRVRTPSGGHPGRTLEDTAQATQANNALLTLIAKDLGVTAPEKEA